jgi:TIR domain/GUN4-like
MLNMRGIGDGMFTTNTANATFPVGWGISGAGVTENLLHGSGTSVPPLFLSSAHEDLHYVKRLAVHLQKSGVSTWFDTDLRWGERWPQRLSTQIQQATGMIVVMSQAAAASEWVEREILEGQHYNRPFRPILLDGQRLFLLNATQFFDARMSNLPGEREIRELQQLLRSAESGHRTSQLIDWGKAARDSDTGAGGQDINDLLAKLHSFLKDSRVAHADILTTSMVLEAAKRSEEGWLHEADGTLLLPGLIAGIDQIWSDSTHGVHGFRAQLALHNAPPSGVRPGRDRDFTALAKSVGWRGPQPGPTPVYTDFVTPRAGNWPPGFFPTLRNPQLELRTGWHERWVQTVMAVHLRLRSWERPL